MGHFSLLSLGCLVIFLSLSEPKELPVLDAALEPMEIFAGAKGHNCPVNWLPVSGKCYRVFSEQRTWDDAERFCRRFHPGCHLASIHSDEESEDLAEYIGDYLTGQDHVWIGLRDTNKNYNWQWSDKSRNNYVRWAIGEPNHALNKEFCVEIFDFSGFRTWNDRDCSTKRPYLCQCPY